MFQRLIGHRSVWVALAVLAIASTQTVHANADPVVKLRGTGTLDVADNGFGELFLAGMASHLGNYVCVGELDFVFNDDGSRVGLGVVALRAANDDFIVGTVELEINADDTGSIAFHWADQVTFADGTVFSTTGRFRRNRPAGAREPIRNLGGPLGTATLDAGE